jgi:hypothetical protein
MAIRCDELPSGAAQRGYAAIYWVSWPAGAGHDPLVRQVQIVTVPVVSRSREHVLDGGSKGTTLVLAIRSQAMSMRCVGRQRAEVVGEVGQNVGAHGWR